jgi:hypothetical protein
MHFFGAIMLNRRITKFASITILATAFVGGCESSGSKPAPPPEGISVDSTDNDLVTFSPPQVSIDKDIMTITGTVTRKPGVHDVISGRIDIDVFASNGESLAWIPTLITPDPVPDDQKGESTYIIRYGLVPPAGSTIQVHYVDKATAIQEDVDDREYTGGGYGGGRAGGGGGGGHVRGRAGGHMGW